MSSIPSTILSLMTLPAIYPLTSLNNFEPRFKGVQSGSLQKCDVGRGPPTWTKCYKKNHSLNYFELLWTRVQRGSKWFMWSMSLGKDSTKESWIWTWQTWKLFLDNFEGHTHLEDCWKGRPSRECTKWASNEWTNKGLRHFLMVTLTDSNRTWSSKGCRSSW